MISALGFSIGVSELGVFCSFVPIIKFDALSESYRGVKAFLFFGSVQSLVVIN